MLTTDIYSKLLLEFQEVQFSESFKISIIEIHLEFQLFLELQVPHENIEASEVSITELKKNISGQSTANTLISCIHNP